MKYLALLLSFCALAGCTQTFVSTSTVPIYKGERYSKIYVAVKASNDLVREESETDIAFELLGYYNADPIRSIDIQRYHRDSAKVDAILNVSFDETALPRWTKMRAALVDAKTETELWTATIRCPSGGRYNSLHALLSTMAFRLAENLVDDGLIKTD